MDRKLLYDAVIKLEELGPGGGDWTSNQGVSQLNALMQAAGALHPTRPDIQALEEYKIGTLVSPEDFRDTLLRLRTALDLRLVDSVAETLAQVELPADAPEGLSQDVLELEEALSAGLSKSAVLLAGSIAEALLVSRHPDASGTPPTFQQLVAQGREERLFSRETLRHLEALADYRDFIHPKADTRNRTPLDEARLEGAVTALRLLSSELREPDVRFSG